jgi:hypothetical protein
VLQFKVLYRELPERTREMHRKPHSRWTVSRQRFEPDGSGMQSQKRYLFDLLVRFYIVTAGFIIFTNTHKPGGHWEVVGVAYF